MERITHNVERVTHNIFLDKKTAFNLEAVFCYFVFYLILYECYDMIDNYLGLHIKLTGG